MSKRDVSAIVSGMGVGMAILTALMEEVKGRGLSEETIHRLATPEGNALLKEFVSVLVEADSNAIVIFNSLQVNYDLSAEEAIKAGKYGWVKSDINNESFENGRSGTRRVELRLFYFSHGMTSKEVVSEMGKEGYRPAEFHELLALGAGYPNEQRKKPILALGSVERDCSHRVPCLGLYNYGRELGLVDVGCWAGGHWRFAAVKK